MKNGEFQARVNWRPEANSILNTEKSSPFDELTTVSQSLNRPYTTTSDWEAPSVNWALTRTSSFGCQLYLRWVRDCCLGEEDSVHIRYLSLDRDSRNKKPKLLLATMQDLRELRAVKHMAARTATSWCDGCTRHGLVKVRLNGTVLPYCNSIIPFIRLASVTLKSWLQLITAP